MLMVGIDGPSTGFAGSFNALAAMLARATSALLTASAGSGVSLISIGLSCVPNWRVSTLVMGLGCAERIEMGVGRVEERVAFGVKFDNRPAKSCRTRVVCRL